MTSRGLGDLENVAGKDESMSKIDPSIFLFREMTSHIDAAIAARSGLDGSVAESVVYRRLNERFADVHKIV